MLVLTSQKSTMTITRRGFFRFFIFFSGYLLFLVLGSSVFSAIEAPEEKEKVASLRKLRSDFLKNHPCVPGKLFNFFLYFMLILITIVHT
uniref:Potassium channel subfamily K member 1-like n=1 Tax=Diabrotica virgifera virgifera TaxID=50390 RepID=A0A6P7G8C0_DIAVI